MTLVAGGALACHEMKAWQWPAATASLRVDGRRPVGRAN
jgi:hypothetical protein